MNIIEVTKYQTEDGKQFDVYEDAVRHLASLTVSDDDLIIKDFFGNPIPLEKLFSNYDEIMYMNIRTPRALEFIEFIVEEIGGYSFPHEKLTEYRYSEEADEWVTKEEDFARIEDLWSNFE